MSLRATRSRGDSSHRVCSGQAVRTCVRCNDDPAASILHADLDSFYASVEQRDDPALRGRPIAVGCSATGGVGARGELRGQAHGRAHRDAGVRRAAAVPRSDRCPAPLRGVHEGERRRVRDLPRHVTDRRADVDRRGVHRCRRTVADRRDAARHRRAPADHGSPTRSACRSRSASPGRSSSPRSPAPSASPTVCSSSSPTPRSSSSIPLPVERLWGVGRITAAKLNQRGLYTVADVANLSADALTGIVGGASGRHLHALAHNRDPRPVETGRRRRSIGSQQALGRRRRTREEIDVVVWRLVDRITRRMRRAERVGRTVTLRVRFDDFTRATRSHSLPARDVVDRHDPRHRRRVARRQLGACCRTAG